MQRTCEPHGLSHAQCKTKSKNNCNSICSQLFLPRRSGLPRRSLSSTKHAPTFFVVQRCAVWISHQRPILSKTRIHDQSRSIHAHSISFTKEPGVQCPACWGCMVCCPSKIGMVGCIVGCMVGSPCIVGCMVGCPGIIVEILAVASLPFHP